MANEKRLIDANALKRKFDEKEADDVELYGCVIVECFPADDAKEIVDKMPTVDAVEVEKYNRLLEMYHELRENFVDFVCSGIPNVAPYCLNRCDGCCDAYGWCRHSDKCQGFNPAEVILDGERKDNGSTQV